MNQTICINGLLYSMKMIKKKIKMKMQIQMYI